MRVPAPNAVVDLRKRIGSHTVFLRGCEVLILAAGDNVALDPTMAARYRYSVQYDDNLRFTDPDDDTKRYPVAADDVLLWDRYPGQDLPLTDPRPDMVSYGPTWPISYFMQISGEAPASDAP